MSKTTGKIKWIKVDELKIFTSTCKICGLTSCINDDVVCILCCFLHHIDYYGNKTER